MRHSWLTTVLAALLVGSTTTSSLLDDVNLSPDFDHAPFLHGVASADPLEDRVMIWTRISPATFSSTPKPKTISCSWSLWEADDADQSFDRPLQSGTTRTSASDDYTIMVDVDGLKQGTRYKYQFQDSQGHRSQEGMTKTLSTDSTRVKVAYLSCTSLWSGYFNLYRHLSSDKDVDFVLHLGDFVYPEIDKKEMHRIPDGLCEDWHWFHSIKQLSEKTQKKPQGNGDASAKYLHDFIKSLDCSSDSLLERFRWIHHLYMLDPDFRAARAKHPFVVALDNHDQHGLMSGRLPVDGSRQAAREWVPQRTQIRTEEAPLVSTLRQFRLGGNLLDVIVLQTYGYSGDLIAKKEHGLLGDGQHEWLDEVLLNSSLSDVQWRMFGSGKTFMPFAVNHLGSALAVPLRILSLVLFFILMLCVTTEVYLRPRSGKEFFEILPSKEPAEPLESTPLVDHEATQCQTCLCDSFKALWHSHKYSPFLLRWCTINALTLFITCTIVSTAFTAFLLHKLNSSSHLTTLNPSLDTWEGQMDSVGRLFDQLEATGTDQNNFWASGDMHFSFAADVFRFDPASKDSILRYSNGRSDVKRYGVEMLPASGTRGNIDELVGLFVPFVKPGSLLSGISDLITNYVVSKMNPHFFYFDGQRHGYGTLTVTPTHMEASFLQFPILEKTDSFRVGKTLYVARGDNKWNDQPPPGAVKAASSSVKDLHLGGE